MNQSQAVSGALLVEQAAKFLRASSLVAESSAVGERLENIITTALGIPAGSKYVCTCYLRS